jgi:hypothetical protein
MAGLMHWKDFYLKVWPLVSHALEKLCLKVVSCVGKYFLSQLLRPVRRALSCGFLRMHNPSLLEMFGSYRCILLASNSPPFWNEQKLDRACMRQLRTGPGAGNQTFRYRSIAKY